MKIRNRKRPCPLCSSTKSETLYVQKFAGGLTHVIGSCKSCGFVFVTNSPDQAFYNRYYRSMSKYEIERGWGYHERYADVIAKHCPKDARLLDIGSSTGHFLSVLAERGFTDVRGLDPSPVCRKIARERYGVRIETDNLYTYRPKKRFQVVVLAAVLEHLDLVQLAVKRLGDLLEDGGYLFIAVPDAGRFYEKFDEPYGEFSTEHINFFTETDLYRVFSGYRNVHMHSDTLAIYSLWQKESAGRVAIGKYIEASREKMDRISAVIRRLPDEVIVWGAGALTRRLLATTDLRGKVVRLVDKSTNLVGTKLDGLEIISPEDLVHHRHPVLVSTFMFRDEICSYIKEKKLPNKVYTFA